MKSPGFIFFGLILMVLAADAHAQGGASASQPAGSGTSANQNSGMMDSLLQGVHKPIDSFANIGGESTPVPVQTRPFVLSLPRDHMLGDWGGLLPKLEDMGITPTFSYVSNMAGNPTGGKSQGFSYADNIGLELEFDLDKLVGLKGGEFVVSMSQRDGTSLSQKFVGNSFTIQQVYGGQTFHLIDVAYQQKLFDDRVELSVGRIAAGDDFLVSVYDYLFMQNGFDGNPVGIFFNSPGMTAYPNATWGGRIKFLPTLRTYIMAGVYNGDSSIRANDNHGADMTLDGPVFAITEVGYINNGLPGDSQLLGHYKAGAWYDHSSYTDYKTVGYSTSAQMKQGNWGFYGMFDQVLVPFGEPASNRGFGIFGSALISPDQQVSQMPYFFTGGVACRGLAESRPKDIIGLGAVFGEFSGDLRGAQEREQLMTPGVGIQKNESVIELTYRFSSANGSVFVQPDLQYVVQPGGTGQIGNAFVMGCQIGVNF